MGSQKKLADGIKKTQPFVSLMLHDIKPVPSAICMDIEALTKSGVTAIQLRPDVFKRVIL